MIASLLVVALELTGTDPPPASSVVSPSPVARVAPVPPVAAVAAVARVLARSSPTLNAARAPGAIVLDGRLGDPAWAAAVATDTFTQQYPHEGAAPTERTTVRVLYDDRALYVGIDCAQSQTPIVARLTRRDRVAAADRVTVDISSRADRVTAFHFGVNAAGVLDDGIYFNDTDYSADWDENWEAATSIHPDGWSAELKIPFRILRFESAPRQTWGLQVQRYTELRHEWDLWAWRSRAAPGVVSTFGTLEGVDGIQSSRQVEARLTQSLKLRFRDEDASRALFSSLGIDGKAHPTQGTTLDLTVNPDFGQVEADQVVLNLSNFELTYPEKRPFFLEGLDTFSTTRSVLYTRRIGARPAYPLAAGETWVDDIGPSRIWAAAKFVGTATPRTSVGVLSAVTGENTAQLRQADGAVGGRTADPLSIYNALRFRQRFGLGGDVGVLVTTANRRESGGGTRFTNDAYVAALDGRWRSPSANYLVLGQVVGSVLAGGPPRPSRDGIAVTPGQPSFGASMTAAKRGGPHWLATISQEVSGPQLDYNDLGYLARKNDVFTYAELIYRTLEPWWNTTDTSSSVAVSHRQALDGIRLEDHLRLSTYATFTNFWAGTATVYYHAPHFDDRETGDGTALERAGLWGTELWGTTDPRRLVTGSMWGQLWLLSGGVQMQVYASLVMRPFSRVDFELAPSTLYTEGEPRFIEKDANASVYYFGRLRANNLAVTARATVGLLPTLTLQFYGQLFLATKRFTEPSQFRVSGAAFRSQIGISDLQPIAPWQVPDVEQAALNLNAVLRWEYRVGSIIYFVYSRAQSPDMTLMPGQIPRLDARFLSGNRGSIDTVMLKASFWWG